MAVRPVEHFVGAGAACAGGGANVGAGGIAGICVGVSAVSLVVGRVSSPYYCGDLVG